jgi:hypothetical protein
MLHNHIKELNIDLCIIDNLGLVIGDVEENSARMTAVMSAFRFLADRLNIAFIIIHHKRKGHGQERAGDALRGHSSIEAAVDLAILVSRAGQAADVTIRSTKTRGVDVYPIRAQFNFEHKSGTRDLEKAWWSGVQASRGENQLREAILIMVENQGSIVKGHLAEEVKAKIETSGEKVGINRVRNWIDAMVENEELVLKKSDKNASIITLPEGQF